MTSQVMNHEEAISRLAAERYLLGEMEEQERAAFEAHYLNCAKCLEDVTFGDEFMQAAQPVAHELATAEAGGHAAAAVRGSGGFFGWLRKGFTNPAPAWAMAVVVLGLGISNVYQVTVVQKQKNVIANLKAPRQEFRFMLTSPSQRRGNESVIQVKRHTQLSLSVRCTFSGENAYTGEIQNEAGTVKYSVPVSFQATEGAISITLLADTLPAGSYSLQVWADRSDGSKVQAGQGVFNLQFVD